MSNIHTPDQPKDLELEQCHIRLFLLLPLMAIWFLYWLLVAGRTEALNGIWVLCGVIVFGLPHWFVVKRNPGVYNVRRAIAMSLDHATCFFGMLLTGELGAVIAFVVVWISLGYGVRFGVKWMVASTVLGSAGLLGLYMLSVYWSQHAIWIFSLLVLNLAIPAYVAKLIRGIHEGRAKLAKHAEMMAEMALRDALTGLPNRPAFFDTFKRISSYAQHHGTSLALIYFDLDGFKRVNDVLGHAAGDNLLKETAKRVNDTLRGEDVLARLGGDEFAVLLPVDDPKAWTSVFSNRILQTIASIDEIDGKPVIVTASVGIVIVSGEDAVKMGVEQIVHAADTNMYTAKKEGKNQVVLTHFPVSSPISLPA